MSMIGNLLTISEQQLQQFLAQPSLVSEYIYSEQENEHTQSLDLDKSWHAIHFILNGAEWTGGNALAMVFFGGEEIGADLGMGPARYLTTGQVKQVSEAISKVTQDQFSTQYNPQALEQADIYPNVWEEDGDESLEYLLPYFEDLKKFYQEASLREQVVLIYIN